jgi:hypothetical protein
MQAGCRKTFRKRKNTVLEPQASVFLHFPKVEQHPISAWITLFCLENYLVIVIYKITTVKMTFWESREGILIPHAG